MSEPKKIDITIVVNGQSTVVNAVDSEPLGSVIPEALRQTGNSGRPPEDWELRDASGNPLDPNKKIGDYNFTEKTTLFLSLKAGAAGHD